MIGQFESGDAIINPNAQHLLNNPIDKVKIDSAVQELKKDRSLKNKTITLSNSKKVTLSVE